jgi:hypothetical protein
VKIKFKNKELGNSKINGCMADLSISYFGGKFGWKN